MPAVAFTPQAPPQRQSVSIEVDCVGRSIGLAYETDRFAMSRIRSISVDGVPVDNESTRAIAAFLVDLRSASIRVVSCCSPTEVTIGITGSRLHPAPGTEDDVLEHFPLRLEADASSGS